MRYNAEHVAASRDALVRAAARTFREKGYAGVGVDELSKQAGVTSGSFYKHFGGKSDAFLEVVKAGVDRVAKRVRSLKSNASKDPVGGWINDFATLHSSKEHLRSTGLGCNLPTLSVEVARSDDDAKRAFEESIKLALAEMTSGEPFGDRSDGKERAIAVLSVLTGAMAIARGVKNPRTAQMITESARRAALLIAANSLPDTPRSKVRWTPAEF
jgi:TetR/AcrR family transcriptional regulator, transcriptional repressor for nem operon